MEFLSGRQKDGFSLDQFKTDYQYYCRDLLDLMDEGFKDYLQTFFFDEGKPEFSLMVKGAKDLTTPDSLMYGLKEGLKPALYNKFIENVAYYAPPLHSSKRICQKESARNLFYIFSVSMAGSEHRK